MKPFIIGILTFSLSLRSNAQNYDSLKICLNNKEKVNLVELGKYRLLFNADRLVSFDYSGGNIGFRNNNKGRIEVHAPGRPAFSIEAVDNGLYVKGQFVNKVINRLEDINSVFSERPNNTVVMAVDSMQFLDFTFKDGKLRKVVFTFNSNRVNINCNYDKDILTGFNFMLEGEKGQNAILFSFLNNYPELVVVEDKNIGVGVVVSYHLSGAIKQLQGKYYTHDQYRHDPLKTLEYRKNGKIKKNSFTLNQHCLETESSSAPGAGL